jgi:peptide/nickel transport system substrate-binding protein
MLLERDPVVDSVDLDNAQLQYVSCERLMTYDGRSAKLVPQLAAAPPAVSADGRVYTFRIKSGYRFSPPSGQPVTAAAFERMMERSLPVDDVVGAAAYQAGRASRIAGVSARGGRLTIRLTRPSPILPARLATFSSCAVPPDTPARPRGLERIATAGPYYIAAVTPKRRIVLRRNPGYPGPASRGPEVIEVTIGTTPGRAIAAVEAGRADYFPEVPPRAQARLIARYGPGSPAAEAGRQQYFSGPSPAASGYVFNPRRPLFARVEMRRAVNYAIDRRALAQHPIPAALGGRPTDQHIPPGWPGYRDAAIYPLGGPDLAAARRLAGTGHHRGVLYTCNHPECLEQAEIVRENLAAIGIELETRTFTFGNMFTRLEHRDEPYDISETGWIGWTPDASEFADVYFGIHGSTAFLNRTPRVRDAVRLTGAPRVAAYAALDRDIAAHEAPFAMAVSATTTDFFSARIGCQAEDPIYGIDLGALCTRD